MKRFCLLIAASLVQLACSGPREPASVELAVFSDASAIDVVTTDLGYEVELSEARLLIDGLQFTIAGEVHATSLWQKVSDFLLPRANAHPGHYQGGEVTGELRGRLQVDWLPGAQPKLGTARLLVGAYHSANFIFATASQNDDDLAADDALIGHTALLRGAAVKDDVEVEFVALLDAPKGRELVGAPFDYEVVEGANVRLGLALTTTDPAEGDTLFDGIDFVALDADGDGRIVLEETEGEGATVDAYNQLRRTFLTHDHFAIQTSKK